MELVQEEIIQPKQTAVVMLNLIVNSVCQPKKRIYGPKGPFYRTVRFNIGIPKV